MKYTVFVCLIALTLAVNSAAQMPPLQQGVHVEMAKTANAATMPEADNEDAWVVSVTADGRTFFGVKPVTENGLFEMMRETPRHRDQDLYIKTDARASFANLRSVLKVASVDGFASAVLLTNQSETPALGKLVAPKGLTVMLAPSVTEPVTVQLRDSGEKMPKLMVSGREISASDLQNALNQALQGSHERVVRLQADDDISFAEIAFVIDGCSSIKAKVAIAAE